MALSPQTVQAAVPAHHLNPIPAAIRRQAEAAERLYTPPQVTNDANPPANPALDGNSGSNPASQPEPVAPPVPPAPVVPEDADIKAQLRSTQGRLDAERERTSQLGGQVASLERMVRELQQQRSAPATPPTPPVRLVTEEEENDYGKELLDVMGKRAMDAVQPVLDALRGEVASLKGQLAQVGRTAQAAVTTDILSELSRRVPGWEAQNRDPAFLGWLAKADPYSGAKRQDLLLDAFNGQDTERVVRFFQGFLDEAAATGAAPQPAPTPAPAPAASGRVPLETFAAPGKASPAASTTPPGLQNKPLYKQSEITSFYTSRAAGQWRGREADAAAIEADIFRAQHEGRVTAG